MILWKIIRKIRSCLGGIINNILSKSHSLKPVTHPLHLIYHQARLGRDVSKEIKDLPKEIRRQIDLSDVLGSIDDFVHTFINRLSERRRREVFEEFDRIAPEPKGEVTLWETELLILALNNRALLPGKGECIMSFDNALNKQPHRYACQELPDVEGIRFGYVNGITRPFSKALADAKRLSNTLLNNARIYGVHNASNGGLIDLSQAFLHQGGKCFKTAALLQQEWREYLSESEGIYVQLCHSDGASCTYHALKTLEKEYRERIIVIAIAPATFIPKGFCKAAYHVANEKDPVVRLSILRAMADQQKIVSIAGPSKGHVPHDPFDPKKMEAVQKILTGLQLLGDIKPPIALGYFE